MYTNNHDNSQATKEIKIWQTLLNIQSLFHKIAFAPDDRGQIRVIALPYLLPSFRLSRNRWKQRDGETGDGYTIRQIRKITEILSQKAIYISPFTKFFCSSMSQMYAVMANE